MTPLLSEESFARYRHFRAEHLAVKYTEPFVPCVNEQIFASGLTRFVYCGAAVAEPTQVEYGVSDREAWLLSQNDTKRIVLERAAEDRHLTAFWKLWNAASELLHGMAVPRRQRMGSTVWTNLSKLGVVGQPAPPDDSALSELDVIQFERELDRVQPHVLLCVSGEMLTRTGNALFERLPRLSVTPRTRGTHLKRLPTGGVLVWTNHPAHLRGAEKEAQWYESIMSDLRAAIGQ